MFDCQEIIFVEDHNELREKLMKHGKPRRNKTEKTNILLEGPGHCIVQSLSLCSYSMHDYVTEMFPFVSSSVRSKQL